MQTGIYNNQSKQERAEGYYWYEAVFMDNEAVKEAFESESNGYPKYEIVPAGFHVTTQFKPESRHERLYGTIVKVHITGSYTGAAKYTEQLDFTDMKPVDINLNGIFGVADSDGKIILN